MGKKRIHIIFGILALILAIAAEGAAAAEETGDTNGAPYFFVHSDDPETDRLPLKSTSVDAVISGVIADVTVTQVYRNAGENPLEAVYVFPASTKAAVYGMDMTVGERTITAEIREKQAARQEYEQAKQAGKSASLLEQHRPNVFRMNVANILPGDVVTVTLRYTELLVPTDGIYAFVYPAVVGPRYVGQAEVGAGRSENWAANPYLHEGEMTPYTFDITTSIHAGLPVQSVICDTHKTAIDFEGKNDVSVALDPTERRGGNRDYILRYSLAGRRVETGMLLYEGEHEKFFLMMMQPPERVKAEAIPPREYIFVVDVSGSMHGFPLDTSKKLLRDLVGNLRPCDRFNVMFFAGGRQVMARQSLPATAANVRKAVNMIDRQRGGGGTRLLPALKQALSMPGTDGYSRNFIIVTDGYVTVETDTFDLIRNNLGKANVFAFGIGSSVNRHIIEGMARAGAGEPFVVTRPDRAATAADRFRKLVRTPVLTDIRVDFGKFRACEVAPGSIPDVMAERPVIVFGKYSGRPEGRITLTGTSGNRAFSTVVDAAKVKPSTDNAALRYLWARHRIAMLADYNRLDPTDERAREVTTLGLTYNLLTDYTSFVAVDKRQRLKDGKTVTVTQPLPLPQGVSDAAVGGCVGTARQASPCTVPKLSRYKSVGKTGNKWAASRAGTAHEESVLFEKDRSAGQGRHADAQKPGPPVRVVIHSVAADHRIPGRAAERFVRRHANLLNQCCRKTAAGRLKLPAGLKAVFTVDRHGRLVNVRTGRRGQAFEALEKCLMQKMKHLRFPAPRHGRPAHITVTLGIKV